MGRVLRALLLLFIFSLGSMQPIFFLLGQLTVPTDVVFLILSSVFGLALLFRRVSLKWRRSYALILLYFAALAVSALLSEDPARSAAKLVGQGYLVAIAVLLSNLVRTEKDLRDCFLAWIAASAMVALVAVASLVAYFAAPQSGFMRIVEFHSGSLGVTGFPRFRLTFFNANMLCSYLTASLAILVGARWKGWIGRLPFFLVGSGIVFAALFTVSPGLGGLALAAALAAWVLWRDSSRRLARAALWSGAAVATAFLIAMAVTPFATASTPFLLELPGGWSLAPAVRTLIWIDAASNFVENPLFGRGIGLPAAHVLFVDPTGVLQTHTDAHNIYLALAVQAGAAGLAALIALSLGLLNLTRPWRLDGRGNAPAIALGIGFATAFLYEGLGGSFEDARHIWALIGLLIASRAEACSGPSRTEAQ